MNGEIFPWCVLCSGWRQSVVMSQWRRWFAARVNSSADHHSGIVIDCAACFRRCMLSGRHPSPAARLQVVWLLVVLIWIRARVWTGGWHVILHVAPMVWWCIRTQIQVVKYNQNSFSIIESVSLEMYRLMWKIAVNWIWCDNDMFTVCTATHDKTNKITTK